MGMQEELMWESLCSMYHAHKRERERRTLHELELKLVDTLLDDQHTTELDSTLRTLSDSLQGAEIFLLECDLSLSGVVIATTLLDEYGLRWPLSGPFARALQGKPSVIFDALRIPVLKVLPIVRAGHARSLVTRAWTSDTTSFILIAAHSQVGYFSHAEQLLIDRGAQSLKARGAQHLDKLGKADLELFIRALTLSFNAPLRLR